MTSSRSGALRASAKVSHGAWIIIRRGAMPIRLPTTEIDSHVALRIREARFSRGLTQRQLAAAVGITNGQISKYEQGLNRVCVGSLYRIACALDLPICYFFDALSEQPPLPAGPIEVSDIIFHASAIKNEKRREAFCQMVRTLADAEGGP